MAAPEVPTEPAPADLCPDESAVTGPSVTGFAAEGPHAGSAADRSGPAAETARRKRTIGERVRATPRFLASIPVTLTTVGLLLLAGILTGTLFAPADPTDPTITRWSSGCRRSARAGSGRCSPVR